MSNQMKYAAIIFIIIVFVYNTFCQYNDISGLFKDGYGLMFRVGGDSRIDSLKLGSNVAIGFKFLKTEITKNKKDVKTSYIKKDTVEKITITKSVKDTIGEKCIISKDTTIISFKDSTLKIYTIKDTDVVIGHYSITVGYQEYFNLNFSIPSVNDNFALGMPFISVISSISLGNEWSLGLGMTFGFPSLSGIPAEYTGGIIDSNKSIVQPLNSIPISISGTMPIIIEPGIGISKKFGKFISFFSDFRFSIMPARNLTFTSQNDKVKFSQFAVKLNQSANIFLPIITFGISLDYNRPNDNKKP